MAGLSWREEAISRHHDRLGFDCGQVDLNQFLAKFARQAHESSASKTFVAVDSTDGQTIYGFYTITPTDLDFDLVPLSVRPRGGGRHPISGFRLARLAVAKSVQGKGIGGEILLNAARRCIRVSQEVGGSLLLIDAKDDNAARWYKKFGALELPQERLTLVLPFATILKSLQMADK